MDLKNTVNAASLLYDGMIRGKSDIAKIPFYPQKTYLPKIEHKTPFPKAAPEHVGLKTRDILRFCRTLSSARTANIHSMLLLCNGKQIFEAASPGYDIYTPHAVYSFSKTVTGLAIGMLIEDNRLSLGDYVYTFFPEYKPQKLSKRMRLLTVRHLLTMSSGVLFNETGAVVEENWVKSFLDSTMRFTPGKEFAYNSMNSYMLSAIVTRVCGRSLSEFLQDRLWEPLGITNAFWEKCPNGIDKGGWGLYLSVIDMTKVGQMLLDGGVYHGKRIIGEDWISEATRAQIEVPQETGPYNYGYHIWSHREDETFLLNGMLGQNTRVDPVHKTVLTVTAGDPGVFQDTPSLVVATKALTEMTHANRSLAAPFARARIRRAKKNFRTHLAWLSTEHTAHEASYESELASLGLFRHHIVSSTGSAGLLPFFLRLTQNNHTKGIRRVVLRKKGNILLLALDEGDESYVLHVGHKKMVDGVLTVHGERYLVRSAYECTVDENRLPILKVHIVFPELSCDRRFIFRRTGNQFSVSLTETPGFAFVDKLVNATQSKKDNGLLDFFIDSIPIEKLLARASSVYTPTLTLAPRKNIKNAKNAPKAIDKK